MHGATSKRIDANDFERLRREVFSSWPKADQFDLSEAIEYQKALPRGKVAAHVIADAESDRRILLAAHAGRATLEDNLKLYELLEESGVDLLPVCVDSHTRLKEYQEAEDGLAESMATGRNLLNGIPLVAYGVNTCRRLTENVHRPLVTRVAAADPRLFTEIGLAAGFTGCDSGPLGSFVYANRATPLAEIIRYHQYVDRLIGIFEEHDVPIVRQFAAAPGVIVPPSLVIVMRVINSLIAAEQGVRHMKHDHCGQCNIIEAVAAMKVDVALTKEYLSRFGYEAEIVTEIAPPVFHFPKDHIVSAGLLALCAVMTAAAGARVFFCFKSIVEATGLPTSETTAATMREARALLDILRHQQYPETAEVRLEMEMMEKECRLMLERILVLGDGDVVLGTCKAFETGEMDMGFTSNRLIMNRILSAKDKTGAVRFVDCGHLPFTREVREFHQQKLAERAAAVGKVIGVDEAIQDMLSGMLVKA